MIQNRQNIMNLKQVADYLGIHTSTVYKYAKSGRIPAFKIGSDWRFSKKHLDDWIDEQTRLAGKENAASGVVTNKTN